MFWKKKPKTIICTECKHIVPIEYAKRVIFSNDCSYGTSSSWYCPEHSPAYDRVATDEEHTEKGECKFVQHYYLKRAYVECDEKGKIIIPKNIYESKH